MDFKIFSSTLESQDLDPKKLNFPPELKINNKLYLPLEFDFLYNFENNLDNSKSATTPLPFESPPKDNPCFFFLKIIF